MQSFRLILFDTSQVKSVVFKNKIRNDALKKEHDERQARMKEIEEIQPHCMTELSSECIKLFNFSQPSLHAL